MDSSSPSHQIALRYNILYLKNINLHYIVYRPYFLYFSILPKFDDFFVRNRPTNYVFKKSGGSFSKNEITVGLANNDYIIIEDGLEEGDQIALSNPYEEKEQEIGDEE